MTVGGARARFLSSRALCPGPIPPRIRVCVLSHAGQPECRPRDVFGVRSLGAMGPGDEPRDDRG
jgi:hypothetical protein